MKLSALSFSFLVLGTGASAQTTPPVSPVAAPVSPVAAPVSPVAAPVAPSTLTVKPAINPPISSYTAAPQPQTPVAVPQQIAIPGLVQPGPVVLTNPSGAAAPETALRTKLKQDEEHLKEHAGDARREFDLRQAAEKKSFELSVADKGFFEKRKLRAEFKEKQARETKEFEAEQEKKRKMYDWRYP